MMLSSQLCCKDIKKNEDTQTFILVKRDKFMLWAICEPALCLFYRADFQNQRTDFRNHLADLLHSAR
jgi:hypothetical protein